jgi:hypothetical protein
MVFRSKVDWWLAAILIAVPVLTLVIALGATLDADSAADRVRSWTAPVIVALVYGVVGFPIRYVISEDTLTVRHGLMRSRVRLQDITRVTPSRNPLSSPALSLDRIRIDHRRGRGFMLVSPSDRAGFAAAIRARNPLAEIDQRLLQ